jgi:8-oxo-dGTP pyrophosphatase MutT (NUDIX family)
MELKRELSAGAIVFRKERKEIKYLLLYKKAHNSYRAQWNFPRGWIEEGESLQDTAKREIEEETGITELEFLKGFKENIHFTYRREGELIKKDAIYLLAKTKTVKVTLSFEHDDYGWFFFDNAVERLTFENDRVVLKKAYAFLTRTSLDSFV